MLGGEIDPSKLEKWNSAICNLEKIPIYSRFSTLCGPVNKNKFIYLKLRCELVKIYSLLDLLLLSFTFLNLTNTFFLVLYLSTVTVPQIF